MLLTPLFLWIVFLASDINTKFLSFWYFGRFGYFYLIGLLGWINSEIQLASLSFSKQSEFSMVSTLWCQIFRTLLYWGIRINSKQENIIVDAVSTNRCPPWGTYFYINWRTNFKRKNIFVGMVTSFKNNSQWARSVSTLILTDRWNYCTQID